MNLCMKKLKIKMDIKKTLFICKFLTLLLTYAFIASFADETPQLNSIDKGNDFWFLASPKEWPIMVRPGILGRKKRIIYYSDQFIPIVGNKKVLAFFNPKFVWDSKHTNEQNFGFGARGLFFNERFIFGGNFYYDTKLSQNKKRYNQLGCGVEGMSKWVDVRSNFYFPISSKRFIDDSAVYSFGTRSLIKRLTSQYEEPLRGIDYEGGFLIPYVSRYLETRAYLGGYYYFSKLGSDINGIKGRLEIRPTPLLTLNVEITKDNTFSSKVYVGGYITFPFSLGKSKNPCKDWKEMFLFGKGARPLRKRMTDPVIRDLDVISKVSSSTKESTEVDGITFVDNSYSGGLSDGSINRPYTTIQNGVNNVSGDKWVYVSQGSGNYNENVTLAENVTLWGSGYNGGYNGIAAPGYPVVDANFVSQPIIVASNTTVMGMYGQNGTAGIIYGQDDVSGVNIHHNIATGSVSEFGAGVVFYMYSTSTMSNITVTNNTFSNNGNANVYFNNVSSGTIDNITVSNNSCLDSGDGISFTNRSTGTISNVAVSNNTCSNNTDVGIYFRTNTSNLSGITISNNTCSGNIYGIYLVNLGAGDISDVVVSANTCSDNSISSIVFWNDGIGSFLEGEISNNNSSGTSFGIELYNNNTGTLSSKVASNILTDNFYNLRIKNSGGGTLIADLGGGALSSFGHNSIYNSSSYEIYNLSSTVTAENNWWGQTTGPDPAKFFGDVDYTPWLTTNPN